jgi:raffinose/stachyose/melibiose transport system permease protein
MSTQVAARDARLAVRTRRQRRLRESVFPWLLLLPALSLNVVIVLIPAIGTFYFAFTKWSGIGPAEWIGLDNFRRMLGDEEMVRAFANNVRWLVLSLTVPVAMALVVATLIASVNRGQKAMRAAFFLPVVIATVVAARVWHNLYNPFQGVGATLGSMGLTYLDINFLGDPDLALLGVYLASLWHGWGFQLVIYLAALQQVDPSLYEAAKVDGANRWQQFYHISLPSIRPTLIFMLLMISIGSMLVFDFIYLMTQGGPGFATQVLAYKLFKEAFQLYAAGYASAIGVTVSLFCGVFVLMFIALRRRGWEI